MYARTLRPDDADDLVAVWKQLLPPDPEDYAWLPEIIGSGCQDGLFRGTLIFARDQIQGLGLSCFVQGEAADAFLERPRPFWNVNLLRRLRNSRDSVILDRVAQATANRADGLDLFILEGAGNLEAGTSVLDYRVANVMVTEYLRLHSGFNIRRHLHETEIKYADLQISGGNVKLSDLLYQDQYSLSPEGHGPRAIYGISRDMISKSNITGHAHLVMNYNPPSLKLLPKEQDIISRALEGRTDIEIASDMSISRDAVKQHWGRIYDHVAEVMPGLLGADGSPGGRPKRGREKRRLVIAHCGANPSELRPHFLERN